MSNEYPDGNPKTILGVQKVPLHLVPPSAVHYLALAFADGAKKYGPYNWREKNVTASVYRSAFLRHDSRWWDGEDVSDDAKVHHLAHVMACCAILLDAMTLGKLNDDRPAKGATPELQEVYAANKKEEAAYGPAPTQLDLFSKFDNEYRQFCSDALEQCRISSSEADVRPETERG